MIILSLCVREIERILLFVRMKSAEHKSTSVDLSSDRQALPTDNINALLNALVLDSLFGKFRTNLAALFSNTWKLAISVWLFYLPTQCQHSPLTEGFNKNLSRVLRYIYMRCRSPSLLATLVRIDSK